MFGAGFMMGIAFDRKRTPRENLRRIRESIPEIYAAEGFEAEGVVVDELPLSNEGVRIESSIPKELRAFKMLLDIEKQK